MMSNADGYASVLFFRIDNVFRVHMTSAVTSAVSFIHHCRFDIHQGPHYNIGIGVRESPTTKRPNGGQHE